MSSIWFYALASVFLISLISLVGVFTLSIKQEKLKKWLIYLVSFSAGALFGDAFIHLLPELVEESRFSLTTSFMILSGIVVFFVLEKVIHWHHHHVSLGEPHSHPFSIMILVGDGLHNLLDGLLIGAAYILSIPAGIATTIAVMLHEIPQEIGDFGVLLHGGFSRTKALMLNFASGLIAILGVVVAILGSNYLGNLGYIITAFGIGGFLYIAGSDLIPELHKHPTIKTSIIQLITFLLGMGIMAALLFLE